jgi:hypothetical protein
MRNAGSSGLGFPIPELDWGLIQRLCGFYMQKVRTFDRWTFTRISNKYAVQIVPSTKGGLENPAIFTEITLWTKEYTK